MTSTKIEELRTKLLGLAGICFDRECKHCAEDRKRFNVSLDALIKEAGKEFNGVE